MTKTLSFAVVHFSVAFGVGYLLTGSILVGSLLALVEPTINTVAYHFHEKVWKRIEARRARGGAPGLQGFPGHPWRRRGGAPRYDARASASAA
jgi:uncharacterized membrane protein